MDALILDAVGVVYLANHVDVQRTVIDTIQTNTKNRRILVRRV